MKAYNQQAHSGNVNVGEHRRSNYDLHDNNGSNAALDKKNQEGSGSLKGTKGGQYQ
jgi:hypothetical protein